MPRSVTRISKEQWKAAERHNATITTTLETHDNQLRFLLKVLHRTTILLMVDTGLILGMYAWRILG